MALGDIHLRFVALMVLGGALGPGFVACDAAVLCVAGVAHPPSRRVAGVPLMALGWLWWRAWARLVARGATIFGFFRFKMSTSMKKCRKLRFFGALFSEKIDLFFVFSFQNVYSDGFFQVK
jgi:hypothetical protein